MSSTTFLPPTRASLPPVVPASSHQIDEARTLRLLKRGVWAYFLLLVFEGALRKWFLPSLATPLLIIRDPLAVWLLVLTWKRGWLPANAYLTVMVILTTISIITATLVGHGSLLVALFGGRILLLHFPLIFVIGRLFRRSDVIEMGKATLWIAVPMAVLITLQFYSPQSAWVNRGVGGDTQGGGFDGAMGYFRPPGTFSFTTGTASFFGFLAPFVLFFWLNKQYINKLLLLAATVALLVAIPLSISRTLFFQVALSLLFLLLATMRKPEYLGHLLIALAGGGIALLLLSQTSIFGTATEAFTARFDGANENEGGVQGVFMDRFLGGLVGALTTSGELPFFGYGLGLGTNVGSMLLTGNRVFLVAEGEWGRIIGEMGALLGISLVILRLRLTAVIGVACYKKLAQGDMLPWLLLSFGFLYLAQGGWSQPTSLGFSTLIGGLLIASLRSTPEKL
jgi:hypothetical protein